VFNVFSKQTSPCLLCTVHLISFIALTKGIIALENHYLSVNSLVVKVGDKAPDFTLLSQMGDNVTLSEYFGKKNIVLYFYPKDETVGCTKEACSFRDSYEELTNLGAEVLGVSGQSVESHKSFASHYGLPFILLSDEGNKVRELYGVPSTMGILPGRVTYIIDKKGIVRHIFNSQTQAERHVEEAKKALKQIEEEQQASTA
jgi:peroxiredoxin Q/BCP